MSDFAANIKVEVDDSAKSASVKLDQNQMERISDVRCQVAWLDFDYSEENEATGHFAMVLLGGNADIAKNWSTGEFKSNFNGKWLTINGKVLVYMILASDATEKDAFGNKIGGYEFYVVPVYLNDKICTVIVACNYPDETCTIIGVRPIDDNGLSSGAFYDLKPGDKLEPLYVGFNLTADYVMEFVKKYGESDTWTEEQKLEFREQIVKVYPGKAVTVDENTTIEYNFLPDGNYAYAFEFVNPVGGDNAYSDSDAFFKVSGGEISKVRSSDDITPEELKD